jgi:SAM-dependent methyltransferase
MTSVAGFVDRYDRLMLASADAIHERGAFFNVGYWDERTTDQETASARLVDEVLSPAAPGAESILDVGCGRGGSTRRVGRARPRARVTGVNLSARQLTRRVEAEPRCAFACMNAVDLGFRDEVFDCVVCVEAAFHFDSRAAFFEEALRVLRAGGSLVLSDIIFRSTAWIGDWMVPRANHVESIAEYRGCMAGAGFADVSIADITDVSWHPFVDRSRLALEQAHACGRLNAREWAEGRRYLEGLRHDTVRHYIVAEARRPG